MYKQLTLVIFYFSLLIFQFANAQNVGIGTNTPKAALDVTSNSNGFLPPRMTYAQRNAIVNPAAGLIIYCTDCANGEMQYYNGSNWINMTLGIGSNAAANLPSFTNSCGQTWTTQNLSVSRYRDGSVIPQVTDNTEWQNLTTGAWCWYNNDSATYAATYGRLYNWYAVNDPRGLAPIGWHVPTDAEWNKLVKCIDPAADTTTLRGSQSATAGSAMKEAGTLNWGSPNTGATNSSGFAGLPGGYRTNVGTFDFVGNFGYWWSAYGATSAWIRALSYYYSNVNRDYYDKTGGFSVRVVRD
jgi:uncharacterized protein (TIGR02145 family)